jgi:hypothetical protein
MVKLPAVKGAHKVSQVVPLDDDNDPQLPPPPEIITDEQSNPPPAEEHPHPEPDAPQIADPIEGHVLEDHGTVDTPAVETPAVDTLADLRAASVDEPPLQAQAQAVGAQKSSMMMMKPNKKKSRSAVVHPEVSPTPKVNKPATRSLIKRNSTWVMDPEGLGKDFEHQPFTAPNTDLAHEYGRHHKFLKGKGRLWKTPVSEFGSMGVGMALYFLYLKYLVILMLCMTILTIPSAVMFWSGNGVNTQELGPLNLAGSTLANLGTRDGSGLIANDNSDVAPLLGPGNQLTQIQASYLISLLDFICGIVIFVSTLLFKRSIQKTIDICDRKFVSAADYSIMVRGLPKDATAQEIREHFDTLYQLSEPDWMSPGTCCGCIGKKKARQPGIFGRDEIPHPVEDCTHSLEDCSGSWCAEVSVAFNDGKFIRLFQKLKKHNGKLRHARAKVKLYANDPDPTEGIKRKEARARTALEKQEAKFGRLERAVAKMQRTARNAEQECVAAFVIFNNEESLARCLTDYIHDARWWRKQPKPLRFRGVHSLKITRAAEPSNIKW